MYWSATYFYIKRDSSPPATCGKTTENVRRTDRLVTKLETKLIILPVPRQYRDTECLTNGWQWVRACNEVWGQHAYDRIR